MVPVRNLGKALLDLLTLFFPYFQSRIWITMGLCWSGNTHYWGKDGFPYAESAPMAAQLWQALTPAKVILQVGEMFLSVVLLEFLFWFF